MIQFCERIAESISAYVDGEGNDPERVGLDRASIEAHVRSCSFCGAQRHRLERTRELEAAPEGRAPARLWDSIEATLRDEGIIRDSP